MEVNAVGSSANYLLAQSAQQLPETAEVKKSGGESDGDSDDKETKAAKAAPAASVNSSGQKTGQIINVAA